MIHFCSDELQALQVVVAHGHDVLTAFLNVLRRARLRWRVWSTDRRLRRCNGHVRT